MIKKTTRLRFRRRLRTTQKSVAEAQTQAAQQLDKHVVRRWQKFIDVRRFVLAWLILIGLLMLGVFAQTKSLANFYKQQTSIEGGTYTEGLVGKIANLNPIFATTSPERSIATLVFEPLLRYDEQTNVVNALAENWKVNSDQTVYTINLRPNLFWHDGLPITSQDVVFTVEAIQHPDTQSPLNQSWRGIEVRAVDALTVTFTLPNAFTPFIHSLTHLGLLPSHVLNEIEPRELRTHPFNLQPRVGSGPFVFSSVSLEDELGQVRLTRHESYYLGRPKLEEVIIQTYADYEQLVAAFNDGDVAGAANLGLDDVSRLTGQDRFKLATPPLFNNVMLFYNNSRGEFKRRDFRKALTQLTDTKAIFEKLGGAYSLSNAPVLPGQLGYSPELTQVGFNPKSAAKLLEGLGWRLETDGIRRNKSGQQLELTLVTQNSDEYPLVAEEIQRQWREAGILLKLEFVSSANLQQDWILPHSYELLLFGIDQGVDSDVFVYWHSSEARVGGFNLSEYKNALVDAALEAGRTRRNLSLRRAKYESFVKQWRADVPAMAIYRPVFQYAQLSVVDGFMAQRLANPVDRFFDIHHWTVLKADLPKPL
ncbi:MAG TPA: ABC transporter substrate-binding protein [Candidatus Saccharimonadales bacterium]